MATITLAVQEAARAGTVPARTAAGASPLLNVTDVFIYNSTGCEWLFFQKSGAGVCTVTFTTPGTVDGLAIADRTVTVGATTGDVVVPPLPVNTYNTPGTSMLAGFTVSDVTGLTCAIVRA